jgi:hypothetical protein
MAIFSKNYKDLTVENLVEKHRDWEWDMENLSSNPSITPEFVERHLDWEWDMKYLSSNNPSITPEFVESHSAGFADGEWDMYGLSGDPMKGSGEMMMFKPAKK